MRAPAAFPQSRAIPRRGRAEGPYLPRRHPEPACRLLASRQGRRPPWRACRAVVLHSDVGGSRPACRAVALHSDVGGPPPFEISNVRSAISPSSPRVPHPSALRVRGLTFSPPVLPRLPRRSPGLGRRREGYLCLPRRPQPQHRGTIRSAGEPSARRLPAGGQAGSNVRSRSGRGGEKPRLCAARKDGPPSKSKGKARSPAQSEPPEAA